MTDSLSEVRAIYAGSNGEATRALYVRLEAQGVDGQLAVNLLRAVKNSTRAKLYRGHGHKGAAYDTKGWAIGNLCRLLSEQQAAAAITRWGWAIDDAQPHHRHVLYLDLPTGQVSFHAEHRGSGPEYAGAWDGATSSAERIQRWAANVLDGRAGAIESPASWPPSIAIGEKVDHVLGEARKGQVRDHHCHWPGCTRQVPPAMWGCKEHWARVPQAMRRKIWRAYQPGQEKTLTPSAEYVAAAREIRDWCLEQERQAQQGKLL